MILFPIARAGLICCALIGLGTFASSGPVRAEGEAPKTEAAPDTPEIAPENIVLEAQTALIVKGTSDWDNAEKSLAAAIDQLYAAVAKGKLEAGGPPMIEYLDSDNDAFEFQAFLPLKAAPEKAPAGKGISLGETPAGKVMKFTHQGSFEDMEDVYAQIDDYLTGKGLEMKRVLEEYVSDPATSQPGEMVTNIYVFTE